MFLLNVMFYHDKKKVIGRILTIDSIGGKKVFSAKRFLNFLSIDPKGSL